MRLSGLVYAYLILELSTIVAAVVLRGKPGPVKQHASPTCKDRPLVPKLGSDSFKVLQLADIHLGEFLQGECHSAQDQNTFAAINDLLDAEKPDLIVFSGDQLTGEDSRSNEDRECLLDKLYALLDSRNVHWVTIFGNHDACAHPGCKTSGRILALASGATPTKTQVDTAYGDLVKAEHKAIDNIMYPMATEEKEIAKELQVASSGGPPPPATTTVAQPAAAWSTIPPPTTTALANATQGTLPPPPPPTTTVLASATQEQGAATTSGSVENNVSTVAVDTDASDKEAFQEEDMLVFNAFGSHGDRQKRDSGSRSSTLIGKDWRRHYLRRERAANCSLTGVDGIFESEGGGVSNFRLKIFASDVDYKADKPSFILWFVDTGGGELPEGLQTDQLEWLRKESAAIEKQYGSVPGALYMHIPLAEFAYTGPPSSICKGASDDKVTPLPNGFKLLPLLSEMHVSWIFAGHNHGNDWCCKIQESSHEPGGKAVTENIQLCYGHHSGFGGYSSPSIYQTGARVFQFNPAMARKDLLHQASDNGAHSYVRLRYGGVVADVKGL